MKVRNSIPVIMSLETFFQVNESGLSPAVLHVKVADFPLPAKIFRGPSLMAKKCFLMNRKIHTYSRLFFFIKLKLGR